MMIFMALGRVERQGSFDDAVPLLGDQLAEGSVYRLLAGHGDALFGDDYFADLFKRSPAGPADGAGPDDRDGDAAAGAGGVVGSGGV